MLTRQNTVRKDSVSMPPYSPSTFLLKSCKTSQNFISEAELESGYSEGGGYEIKGFYFKEYFEEQAHGVQ